jgi:hypothetical protein
VKRLFCGLAVLALLLEAAGQIRSDFIYWTDLDGGKIRRANLDGSGQQVLLSGLTSPTGLALDLVGGKMYWSYGYPGTGGVLCANLDGSALTTLVGGVFSPTDIALDLAGGQMYWAFGTFTTPAGIQRANLDRSGLTTLVSGLNSARGITLDLPSGKMYVSEGFHGAGTIRRYNLDGSGEEVLLTDLSRPVEMALDVPSSKMYFSDAEDGIIRRVNLDGSGEEVLISRPRTGPGIVLDLAGGKIYWTEYDSGNIGRANLDGSGQEILLTGLNGPAGIALQIDRAPGSHLLLTAPLAAVSGMPFDVTVTARDSSGNLDPTYQGTVTFSTTDPDSGVVLPADYMFTVGDGGDNGVHTFAAGLTLVTVGEQILAVTDTINGITSSATIAVNAGP